MLNILKAEQSPLKKPLVAFPVILDTLPISCKGVLEINFLTFCIPSSVLIITLIIIVQNIFIQINNDRNSFEQSVQWPYIDTALTHFNKKDPSYDSLTSQKEKSTIPDQKSRGRIH